MTEEAKKAGKVNKNAKNEVRLKPLPKVLPIQFESTGNCGVKVIQSQCHKGWITRIRYFEQLHYLVSSGLDGFIHVHELDGLKYKDNKTFNLHQKGINAFVYSAKHRFIASCGEERHIIMWDPFTLKALQYLKGHNTSVQDLAINEDRSHLLSLGTDKVVKVWDTKTYLLIQTIIDRTQYRPLDELNCLLFDEVSKSIIVGSRKINFWPFKT